MITIRNLEGVSAEGLFEAFDAAFADYDVVIGRAELENMLRRRGDPGRRPVA